jgi:hypothetical protein
VTDDAPPPEGADPADAAWEAAARGEWPPGGSVDVPVSWGDRLERLGILLSILLLFATAGVVFGVIRGGAPFADGSYIILSMANVLDLRWALAVVLLVAVLLAARLVDPERIASPAVTTAASCLIAVGSAVTVVDVLAAGAVFATRREPFENTDAFVGFALYYLCGAAAAVLAIWFAAALIQRRAKGPNPYAVDDPYAT